MDEILHAPKVGSVPNSDVLKQRRSLGELIPAAAGLCRRLAVAITERRKVVIPVAVAAAAAVCVVSVTAAVYTPSYVVTVDGVEMGAVADQKTVEQVVERVEAKASSVLGYAYTLDSEIQSSFALTQRDELISASVLESGLLEQVDGMMMRHVLKVDGQVIGAAEDAAALTALLEEIKAPYVNENTTAVSFTSNVVVSQEYTAADVEQDIADIQAALTANTNGQTVYEVQSGDTFSQIANGNGMTVSEMKELNPDVDVDRIYIGQLLTVKEEIPFLSVRTTEQVTYHEAIACPVQEVEDSSMYQGESRVLDPGVQGDSLVTADVTYVNGKEQERNVVTSTVLSEPTTKVVAVGTKERPSWYPNGYFIWPCYGNITSYFGYRRIFGSTSYHGGLDIAAPYGTRISAADGGTVEFAGTATGSNWSYGKLVVINHGDGRKTYYGHCSSILVSAGDKVYQGQAIARVGSTGRSTGNHCHFEVRINGTRVNPLSYL